jgi:hypothetical protein
MGLSPHSPATIFLILPSRAGRAFAEHPLFFAISFGGIGALMVIWALTDADQRLRVWSPRYYRLIFGSGSRGTKVGGLVRGTFLILLGLYFLYRFLKA